VGTLVVVNAQERAERLGAPRRTANREAVGPFAQERLDESLGLGMGLGARGPGAPVPQAPGAAGRGEDAGAIDEAVVAGRRGSRFTAVTWRQGRLRRMARPAAVWT